MGDEQGIRHGGGGQVDLDLDECVELDRLNMSPILAAAGETFNPAGRKASLAKSVATNGRLVGVWRDGRLVGYLELKFSEGRCAVWSIQVHPRHRDGTVLLQLLRLAAAEVDPARVRVVVSAAHAGNRSSIRLHRLMGFRVVGRNGDKVCFEVEAAALTRRLGRPAAVSRSPARPRGGG